MRNKESIEREPQIIRKYIKPNSDHRLISSWERTNFKACPIPVGKYEPNCQQVLHALPLVIKCAPYPFNKVTVIARTKRNANPSYALSE